MSTVKTARQRPGAEVEASFNRFPTYVKSKEYVVQAVAFDILAIAFEPGLGYDGRDRWALLVEAADRGLEILTLGSNPGRDAQLKAAQKHLERGGSLKDIRLLRRGNAYYLAHETLHNAR